MYGLSVAVAWSVESLPSKSPAKIPLSAGPGVLITILVLDVSFVCVQFWVSLWRWRWHSADQKFQGVPPLCIYLVFLFKVCAPPTRIWLMGIRIVVPGISVVHWRWLNNRQRKKERKKERMREEIYSHVIGYAFEVWIHFGVMDTFLRL